MMDVTRDVMDGGEGVNDGTRACLVAVDSEEIDISQCSSLLGNFSILV
jgi:hypothetical protein